MKNHTFSKTFSSEEEAHAVFAALLPETNAPYERRAKTTVDRKERKVIFRVEARDQHAFLASKKNFAQLIEYLSGLE